ncbi:MAG: vWA domain-containing protein [Pirellulaceae bacterium]
MIPIDAPSVQSEMRITWDLQPIFSANEGWQILIASVIVLITIGLVIWLGRRGYASLPRPTAIALTGLRIVSLLAVIAFALEPQLRTEQINTQRSKVLFLVDTSLSMGFPVSSELPTTQRADVVAEWFADSELWQSLASNHEIEVQRFDELPQTASIVSNNQVAPAVVVAESPMSRLASNIWTRLALILAAALMIVAAVIAIRLLRQHVSQFRQTNFQSLIACLLILSLVLIAAADLSVPELSLWNSIWGEVDEFRDSAETTDSVPSDFAETQVQNLITQNWNELLAPIGVSTRMGDAIQFALEQHRNESLAGIVIVSDGCNNTGREIHDLRRTLASNIPVIAVGMGDTNVPRNLRVTNWKIPSKVKPGDRFIAKAMVTHDGFEGDSARVQVFSRDETDGSAEVLEDERELLLGPSGEVQVIEFELKESGKGRRIYICRLGSLAGDVNDIDNAREAIVETIDRKTVVLLLAGGPHRDFQFLKNQLFRDPNIELVVWLQSAEAGADQESDQLLTQFPTDMEALNQIDVIIGFDPDWSLLTEPQATALEKWVAEQAGGLIVTAGPVNTPLWVRQPVGHPVTQWIRRLYPVVFYNQGSAVLSLGRFGGEHAFPLRFTREGLGTEFLWLTGSDASGGGENWSRFDGVYGYYAVNESKPGADVLAYFSDPATATDGQLPIYLASQHYGGGRVLFQASNEIWRLRRVDVSFFESYYNKLIRWAAAGRLNRGTSGAILQANQENCWVGDEIEFTAILRDPGGEPLVMPTVDLDVVAPDGSPNVLTLVSDSDAARPGTYRAKQTASIAGMWKAGLLVPGSRTNEQLKVEVLAEVPELENRMLQMNAAPLRELAKISGGQFFNEMPMTTATKQRPPKRLLDALSSLPVRNQQVVLPGVPNGSFRRKLMRWLLAICVSSLCATWMIRRLNQLA